VFRPENSLLVPYYEEHIAGPVLSSYCLDCHTESGSAGDSRLVFTGSATERQHIENITAFGRFLDTVSKGREYILDTVSNPAAHGGVTTLAADGDEYTALRALEAEDLYNHGVDGVFTTDFAKVRNWAGRKTIVFPFYGTGSGQTVTVQIKNNRAADTDQAATRLAWSEEFNEPAGTLPNPAIWTPEIGDGTFNGIPGWGNSELQYYTGEPENASTDGAGNLAITVREADGSLGCYYGTCKYTSARLITLNKAEFSFGRIEARIKVPAGVGLWPAFWTLGTDIIQVGWPRTGEIDIMEFVGKAPQEVFGTIHGPGYSAGQSYRDDYLFSEPVSNDFHVFAIEWQKDRIEWYVDDILYHTATPADVAPDEWVFNGTQFLILNVAIGGNLGGPVAADIQLPAAALVDYVRAYTAPDTAELFEVTFKDDARGWREVELPLDNLQRSKQQPANAPDDGYSWFEVWGYNFVLPKGSSVDLGEVKVLF
jgi:beta-glucanase (GH16 family)